MLNLVEKRKNVSEKVLHLQSTTFSEGTHKSVFPTDTFLLVLYIFVLELYVVIGQCADLVLSFPFDCLSRWSYIFTYVYMYVRSPLTRLF